jgi:alkaline phosphatase D
MAAEFAINPFLDQASDVIFTRIGALYPNAAKVVVRYPFTPLSNATLGILWREVNQYANDTRWRQGPIVNLTADSDWVSTVKIEDLWPQTLYECKSSAL